MPQISTLLSFKLIYSIFLFVRPTIGDQNQAPKFDPPLQSNYFFPEFNATKPGKEKLILLVGKVIWIFFVKP
jgi:hypothetical protein